jgi:heptosyltransferase-3
MSQQNFLNNIIISRTDSIGDVMLTLPVAGAVKKKFPSTKIVFLGTAYTKPVIEACKFVDEFIDIKDLYEKEILIDGRKPEAILHVFPVKKIAFAAKRKQIALRIGTTNRIYHWLTCNKLVRLSRKNSELHEAQLNLKLLQGIGLNYQPSIQELIPLFGFEKTEPLEKQFASLLSTEKFNLILHPKSQGNGSRRFTIQHFYFRHRKRKKNS